MKKIFSLIAIIFCAIIISNSYSAPQYSDADIKYWEKMEKFIQKDSAFNTKVNQYMINIRNKGVTTAQDAETLKTFKDEYAKFIKEVSSQPAPKSFHVQNQLFLLAMSQKFLYYEKLASWAEIKLTEENTEESDQILDKAGLHLNNFRKFQLEHEFELDQILNQFN